MKITDKYVFFFTKEDIPSQWYPCKFKAMIGSDKFHIFDSAEQYMMFAKAHLFKDQQSMESILSCKSPAEAKKLGRQVQNFNSKIWDNWSDRIIIAGNRHKFEQNEDLKKFILSTEKRIFVEASPYDKIYGVGLAENDPRILDETKWQRENRLGIAVTIVRDSLTNGEING